ncbi:hypothetical protein [Thermodesulfatator atlanticus]|uniref:hypothetical protein n=1 Tax=Thermodesulfatator atlanticus TaxID=501497 RepID=UPI0003B52F41|nr:hypothetical protein [Thermodesulfatator atlanticus]
MKKAFLILGIVLLVVVGVREWQRKRAPKVFTTTDGRVEMCLACHDESPEKVHSRDVVGCSPCHLGNPLRMDKKLAHRGIVKNPGDLRVVEKTCGRPACHPKMPGRVKKSLMATNRGIINVLRRYWGEIPEDAKMLPEDTVEHLMKTGLNSPALDYFRKLCGSCHLWMEKGKLPDFLKEKGGGCVACHLVKGPKKAKHPVLTRKMPVENCVRCHNRSGRIGLTYQGLYEDEGYGTPYREGDFGAETLVDGRFVRRIPPDVHFKAGLSCVDCHIAEETMGDGHEYTHFEQSVEITCESCHGGKGVTRKGRKIPGVKEEDHKIVFLDKAGKKHPLKKPDPIKCEHKVHQRLTCQACHAPRVPQCFGCHVRRDASQSQLDKLANKETPGAWEEFRSYMRLDEPTLGVKGNKIEIIVPG